MSGEALKKASGETRVSYYDNLAAAARRLESVVPANPDFAAQLLGVAMALAEDRVTEAVRAEIVVALYAYDNAALREQAVTAIRAHVGRLPDDTQKVDALTMAVLCSPAQGWIRYDIAKEILPHVNNLTDNARKAKVGLLVAMCSPFESDSRTQGISVLLEHDSALPAGIAVPVTATLGCSSAREPIARTIISRSEGLDDAWKIFGLQMAALCVPYGSTIERAASEKMRTLLTTEMPAPARSALPDGARSGDEPRP
jgi:hypothetical protein